MRGGEHVLLGYSTTGVLVLFVVTIGPRGEPHYTPVSRYYLRQGVVAEA